MKDWLWSYTQSTFSDFDDIIKQVLKILTQDPSTNEGLWGVVNSVFDIILPIGFTLATLFFFIDFLNKAIMMDYVKWENIVKSLFKLIVCKLVMENALTLLTGIMKAFAWLTQSIGSMGNGAMSNLVDLTPIQAHIEDLDLLGCFGYALEIFPLSLVVIAAKFLILAIAYGRLIQMCLYTAISPLAVSTMAGETTHDIAKGFFEKYVAVCLQGAIIIICCALYYGLVSVILAGSGGGIFAFTISTIVLALLIAKSGSFAKEVCSR